MMMYDFKYNRSFIWLFTIESIPPDEYVKFQVSVHLTKSLMLWVLSVFTCTQGSAEGRPHSRYITHAVCAAAASSCCFRTSTKRWPCTELTSSHRQHTKHNTTLCTFVVGTNYTALAALFVLSCCCTVKVNSPFNSLSLQKPLRLWTDCEGVIRLEICSTAAFLPVIYKKGGPLEGRQEVLERLISCLWSLSQWGGSLEQCNWMEKLWVAIRGTYTTKVAFMVLILFYLVQTEQFKQKVALRNPYNACSYEWSQSSWIPPVWFSSPLTHVIVLQKLKHYSADLNMFWGDDFV